MRDGAHHPEWAPSKSKEQIFRELVRDAKRYWPELPESPERMDPVVRMLYGAFACQFESLYKTIDKTCETIFEALARHLYYDALLSPVPSFTILRFDPTDEGIEIDQLTMVIYTEERGDEKRTYYFSPTHGLKLRRAGISRMFLLTEGQFLSLPEGSSFPVPGDAFREAGGGKLVLYLAVDIYDGKVELPSLNLFIDGSDEASSLLRWGVWIPSTSDGVFKTEMGIRPGEGSSPPEFLHSDSPVPPLIPHHRAPKDYLTDALDRFFNLKGLTASPFPEEIRKVLGEGDTRFLGEFEGVAWVKVVLPSGATQSQVSTLRGIHPNCVPAMNRRHMVHNHATQGLSLVEVTLPEPVERIYGIEEVRDSTGRPYHNRLSGLKSPNLYTIREQDGRPLLIFYFPTGETVPKTIQTAYSITEGGRANGIEPGEITELYDRRRHPGVEAVTNITPTIGGQDPPSREELLRAFANLLRTRSRAVTGQDIESFAYSFDPRIEKVSCKPGVGKGPSGARRHVAVSLSLREGSFPCEEEKAFFLRRLSDYLKERSPVNTVLRIQLMED